MPAPFSGIVFGNFELAAQEGPDEWSFEPGIQYGLGAGFALGLAAQFSDDGEGWDYSSLSPQVQWSLNPGASGPFRFSLLAGYQFGEGVGHDHEETEPESPCGPEYGPDAPSCDEVSSHGHEHTHGGIHQHGEDTFFARFIVEADLNDRTKLDFNLINVIPSGGDSAWGYAAGLRYSFSHEFAVGLEAQGDFDRHGYQEIAAAAYLSPTHALTFKLGAGAGLSSESPDFTVHAGAVFRF